jgi:hypothetical protein
MDDSNAKLLIFWHRKCKIYYHCHRDTANYYDRWDKLIGFPAVIINVFNSSSLFANSQSIQQVTVLIIASLTVLSTFLTACQNYFDLNNLKNTHRKLSNDYSKLLYSIEKTIVMHNNTPNYKIDGPLMSKILDTIELLRETQLEFPEKIWLKYKNEYKQEMKDDNEDDLKTSDTFKQIAHAFKENHDIVETYNNSTKNVTNLPSGFDNNDEKNINIYKQPESPLEHKSSDASYTTVEVKEE